MHSAPFMTWHQEYVDAERSHSRFLCSICCAPVEKLTVSRDFCERVLRVEVQCHTDTEQHEIPFHEWITGKCFYCFKTLQLEKEVTE